MKLIIENEYAFRKNFIDIIYDVADKGTLCPNEHDGDEGCHSSCEEHKEEYWYNELLKDCKHQFTKESKTNIINRNHEE